jgi:hypothetical protein
LATYLLHKFGKKKTNNNRDLDAYNKKHLYMYICKDGSPSTKSTRHVEANVNTQRKTKTKTIKIVVMKWKT